MFLKRFEAQGFKSFADRTSLEFNPGISTIVGPNGSGKSNISDAILWVMGEQKMKTLRSTRGEDVIFSGSDSRKPLGMASVSITMDNARGILPVPYEEVTVTRKAFRSGESEFLINKTPCRLRDIQALFHDTGMGRDSFTMIGQGQVHEIVSARPEERRGMIEELAGVVKYRNRKAEALRKIETTQANRTRILDIIAELGVNMEPLEEEAEKARKYMEIKGELDDLDINLLVRDIEEGVIRKQELLQEIGQLTEETAELQARIAQEESSHEQERLSLEQLQESFQNRQARLYEQKTRKNQLENQQEISRRMQESLGKRQEELAAEQQGQEGKLTRLDGIHRDQVEAHQRLREALAGKEEEAESLSRKTEELRETKATLAQTVESLNARLVDEYQFLANLKNEMGRIALEIENRNSRADRTMQEEEKTASRLRALEEEDRKARVRLEEGHSLLAGLREKQEQQDAEHRSNAARIEEERQGMIREERELQQLQSRLQALEQIQQEHEGFFQGVRTVLSARQKDPGTLPGVIGVLADLLDLDPDNARAIETALGNAVQNLVTRDQEAAKAAIGYLKEKRSGRATFLPLDVIQPRSIPEKHRQVLSLPGILGAASSLVRIRSEYQPVVQHLLGNVLVAENMEAAVQAARKTAQEIRIVTLDGDLITPGGAMTGGHTGNQRSSILQRKMEQKELREAIARKEASLAARNAAFEELASLQTALQQERDRQGEEIRKQQEAIYRWEQDRELLHREIKTRTEELELSGMDRAEMDREKESLQAQKEEHAGKMEDAGKEKDRLEAELSSVRTALEAAAGEYEDCRESRTRTDLELVSLREKEAAMQESLSLYYGQKEELADRLSLLQRDREAVSAEIEGHGEKLDGYAHQIAGLTKEIEALSESMQQEESLREQLDDSLRQKTAGGKEMRRRLEERQTVLHEREVTLARRETDLENRYRRLEERHEMSYEDACRSRRELGDLPAAEKRLRELKREMAFLGTVNLAAIDEHARLRERFEFLDKQEQDLRESIEKLDGVIREIDAVMQTRFQESYDQIQERFRETFAELFGGGHASLVLTDPDDILGTGVEIEARPPGKGLKNINLLSGGEKALTGIALLFAFLKIKPSPFCVLDEIDAALDEMNVNSFAEYLRRFAREIQFVVISHRQGTIEQSDCLYGATMDRSSGVTRMVSVKLRDGQPAEGAEGVEAS